MEKTRSEIVSESFNGKENDKKMDKISFFECFSFQFGPTFHAISIRNTCDVPHANRLIQWCGHNLIFGRMELGAHHVVIVAGQYWNASARLPIPNANRLIVGCTQYPWIFVMEECCAHIIQMAQQCENAATFLIIPELRMENRKKNWNRFGRLRSADVVLRTLILKSSPPETNNGCWLWKQMPRTGPSCSSNFSSKVHIR